MRRLPFILILTFCTTLCGQEFTVLPREGGGGLDVDLDYVWRYNLYEHSRWGLGLAWNSDAERTWRVTGSVGYGLRDRQLKWGAGVSTRRRQGTFYLQAAREYSAAGSRRMKLTSLYDLSDLSYFMSKRMSDQLSALGGYRWRKGRSEYAVDARVFRGGRLFDNNGLLYRMDGDAIEPENGAELRLVYGHHDSLGSFGIEALLGRTWPAQKPIAELIAEYEGVFRLPPFAFHLYTQAGITVPNTPYIYMFDLGGTNGSWLYCRNSLLTVQPCEYTANLFAMTSLRLRLERPLWSWWNGVFAVGSNPRPFVGLNAAWGRMWDETADGTSTYEGLDLRSPNRGVAEAVVGVDGLLRWGIVDYGAAFAVRLTPSQTGQTILSLLLTAELKPQ